MRLRKIPGIGEKLLAEYPDLLVNKENRPKGYWKSYFPNRGPVSLEVGMGRGKFVSSMAKACPDQNFVALEMRDEVIYDAAMRLGNDCPNVAVIRDNAAYLEDWFAPGEIARLYLNFSDPWPKKRHAKRRLTHENFLKLYRTILCSDGEVFFRTDVRELVEFTLVEMTNHGFTLMETSLDFHNSAFFDGITTEYEDRQSKKGPIYYGRFLLKK